jgi:hypothetical protein
MKNTAIYVKITKKNVLFSGNSYDRCRCYDRSDSTHNRKSSMIERSPFLESESLMTKELKQFFISTCDEGIYFIAQIFYFIAPIFQLIAQIFT